MRIHVKVKTGNHKCNLKMRKKDMIISNMYITQKEAKMQHIHPRNVNNIDKCNKQIETIQIFFCEQRLVIGTLHRSRSGIQITVNCF
jgi:hypothetical protein